MLKLPLKTVYILRYSLLQSVRSREKGHGSGTLHIHDLILALSKIEAGPLHMHHVILAVSKFELELSVPI